MFEWSLREKIFLERDTFIDWTTIKLVLTVVQMGSIYVFMVDGICYYFGYI